MTQEEKARAYDKVSKEVKDFFEGRQKMYSDVTQTLEYLFPELKESEDGRIRKDLIQWINDFPDTMWRGHYKKDILAWLEKRGDKDGQAIYPTFTFDDILALQCCMETVKKVQEDKDLYEKLEDLHDRLYDAYQLEKQSEKPQGKSALEAIREEKVDNANKVGPKFKVGDFIAEYYCRGKIVKITDDSYLLDTGQGIPFSCEHNTHLWTIKDAKDGDVLITNKKQPFIFNGHYDDDTDYVYAYCGISDLVKDDSFYANEECVEEESKVWCTSENVCPATKEQRDILFAKMEEAGYEWNENKKELRKIEQKPIDKVETKFNAGDWITSEESVWQVDEVETENYLLIDSEDILFAEEIATIDSEFHLWTIKDAKDGDVLAVDDGRPFIFKGCLDPNHPDSPVAYCGIDTGGYFCVGGNKFDHWWTDEKVHPATKKQRDLLFAKMEEEEYKWDAEKKELKKIETKFNAGDWVVNKLGDVWHIDSIDNKNYQVSDGKGNYNYFPISKQDEMRLWTIADTKDGDVLSMNWYDDDDFWEKIIIFKKYHNKGVEGLFNTPCVEGYGNTFKNGKLALCEEVPYYSKTWTANLQPATKEQRDTLMKAMADAGYEWNDEKKGLRKISQRMISAEAKEALYDKVDWSEEDSYGFDCVAQCITQALLSSNNKQDPDISKCAMDWINSIKQRLTNT